MKKTFLFGVAAIALGACGGTTTGGGNPEDVDAALLQLNLKDSGTGRVEFEDKSVSGADATFKNVLIKTSDFAESDETDVEASINDDGFEVEVSTDSADLKISEMTLAGLLLNEAGQANFERMTLTGIEAVPTDDTEEDVEATVEKFELVKPMPELAAWLGGVFGTAEKADLPAPDKVQFESMKLTNFLMAGKDESEDVNFKIASISAEDVGESKIGSMSIDGFDLAFSDTQEGLSGTFKLGKMSLKGGKTDFLKAALNQDEDEASEQLLNAVYGNPVDPGFDNFELSDFLFDMAGLKISLPSMSYDITRNKAGEPVKFEVPKFTLDIDVDSEGGDIGAQIAPMLLMVGFEDLQISSEGLSTYDPETDIIETQKSLLSIKDALTFSTTSKIAGMKELGDVMSNLDTEAFETGQQDPTQLAMDMYSKLDFHQMEIKLTDEGAINKALMFFAAQQGTEPEQLRQMASGMVAALPMMAANMGIDPALTSEIASAGSKFISEGGTLTLTFAPEEPFKVTSFMGDPTAITKDRLGFSATVE